MATGVFYPSHVPVSALTNRPIIVGHVQKATPQFKCTKCQIILNSPLQAIDHFNNKDCLLEVGSFIIYLLALLNKVFG